ncbi:uncharacterized protein LOC117183130 isoform X2 [Belonocnema kinseyi]|uniref:uncharacterized protein LOC117183130 isoform X2 n=1 Tax=Belonocnema kinseyi TaxID=2817044 RepID=UPI00143CCDC4|nr:uncharacterized protein LOC117183130 isoform X2 [Belonocnema kinseyi]
MMKSKNARERKSSERAEARLAVLETRERKTKKRIISLNKQNQQERDPCNVMPNQLALTTNAFVKNRTMDDRATGRQIKNASRKLLRITPCEISLNSTISLQFSFPRCPKLLPSTFNISRTEILESGEYEVLKSTRRVI